MRNAVITGIGMVTGLGASAAQTFDALLAGRSAVGPAPDEVLPWLPGALAVKVASPLGSRLARQELSLDRATQLGLIAAREAVANAEFDPAAMDRSRLGVSVGIGMPGACTLDDFYSSFFERLPKCRAEGRDPTVVHPLAVPRIMANSTASVLSITLGLRGPAQTYSVACSSSAVAAGEACNAIRSGAVDAMLVVGTEAMLKPGPYFAWNALRVMAPARQQSVAASCRPFDRERAGFVIGEGAAALLLEDEQSARNRGARIYARLSGYGASSDASHMTLPSRDGQAAAMRKALAESGVPIDEIGYVNAHGTATEAGDVTETESLKEVFGKHANRLAVSSTKSMHGHLIGAAGALELAVSVLALNAGTAPPTAHLDHPDPRCDLDYIPNVARAIPDLKAVMSNSFAFGGSNVSLVATKLH